MPDSMVYKSGWGNRLSEKAGNVSVHFDRNVDPISENNEIIIEAQQKDYSSDDYLSQTFRKSQTSRI
jgi:hypothetical protein